MKTKTAWELEPEETTGERADRETRISDFLLFAALPLVGLSLPRVGLPVNEVAALAIVGLSLFRAPRVGPRPPWWFVGMLLAVLAVPTLSAQLNDLDATRRLAHLVGYVGIALCLGSGRVSMVSAARGLACSLTVAVVVGIVTLPASDYPGRLTGPFGDPNVAAFLLTTLGAASVPHVRIPWLRRLLLATIALGVVLTFSRTGLLAMMFALVWLLVGRRFRLMGGGLLVAGLIWVVDSLPSDLRLFGPFSERTGSDALRDRIIAEERVLLDSAPWYGHGPGSARVMIGDEPFFFHNSYLAVRQEGGFVTLALVVGLLACCFAVLNSKHKSRRVTQRHWMQAAIIAVLVMAVSLGEVLLDLPTAVVLGFAMSTTLSRPAGPEPPP